MSGREELLKGRLKALEIRYYQALERERLGKLALEKSIMSGEGSANEQGSELAGIQNEINAIAEAIEITKSELEEWERWLGSKEAKSARDRMDELTSVHKELANEIRKSACLLKVKCDKLDTALREYDKLALKQGIERVMRMRTEYSWIGRLGDILEKWLDDGVWVGYKPDCN